MRLLGQTVFKYAFGQHEEQLDLISAFDWKIAHNFTQYCQSYYSLSLIFELVCCWVVVTWSKVQIHKEDFIEKSLSWLTYH